MRVGKKDLANNIVILKKYIALKEKFVKNSTYKIDFENDVYIKPLFLILIINLMKEHKITIIMDVSALGENTQHSIIRNLEQFIDIEFVTTHQKNIDEDFNKYQNNYKIFKDKKLHILISCYHKMGKFINLEKGNSVIPIIQIKNIKYKDIDLYNQSRRESIKYYKQLSLDYQKDQKLYKQNLKETIEDILKTIELDDKNLSEPFRDIFYELIDNIKKHTSENSNGYISFHKNNYDYELIIADHSINEICNDSFIDRYRQVLETELDRLAKENVDKKNLEEFSKTMDMIDEGKLKQILRELFSFESKNEIPVHQIPRITMHFGIPMLMRILHKVKPISGKKIDIYLHSKKFDRYFNISYDFKNEVSIKEDEHCKINGTYIMVKFPINIEKYMDEEHKTVKETTLSIQNTTYSDILKKHGKIQDFISDKFEYIENLNDYLPNLDNKKSVVISYDDKESFSMFIRKLFLFAYKKDLKDILIYNIHLKDYKEYIEFIKLVTYRSDYSFERSLNIMFYNDTFPSVIFFGGRNLSEFEAYNRYLSLIFGHNLIKNRNKEEISRINIIDSNFFYNKDIFIPFELFRFYKDPSSEIVDIFADMVSNFLNFSSIDLHLDTNQDIHVNKFYQFKKLFENSQWAKRFAYRVAVFLDDYEVNKIVTTDNFSYNIAKITKIIIDKNNIEILRYEKNKNYKNILLLASVLIKGVNLSGKIDNTCILLSIIRFILKENKSNNFESIIDFNCSDEVYEISKEKYCEICEKAENVSPLFVLDKKFPMQIKDFIGHKYKEKEVKGYCEAYSENINWIDSIYFGHTIRGTNHYTYYIRSNIFLEKNLKQVENYFEKIGKNENGKYDIDFKKNSILFVPVHNTNAKFVNIVNQKVFNGNATIQYIDNNNQNIDFVENYFDKDETSYYYVDDAISSGKNYQKIYTFLLEQGIAKIDGIFVLIDRMDKREENYIKNTLSNGLRSIYAFISLGIKPIKTNDERCFLCSRVEEYKKMLKDSALDLTRFQIARKINKITAVNYNKINMKQSKRDRIKDCIKMLAVDFISKNFSFFGDVISQLKSLINNKNNNAIDVINFQDIDIFDNFKKQVKKNLYNHNIFEKMKDQCKTDILNYESDIALIKALGFPPFSYYKNIRDIITTICVVQIRYIADNFKNIENIAICQNSKTDNDIVNNYKNKKLVISKANVYFNILGYFKEVHHLDKTTLKVYANIVSSFKDKKEYLHHYPFSVKFSINNNLEKTNYFLRNVGDIMKEPHDTLFDALYIESFLKEDKLEKINDNDIDKLGDNIKKYLEKYLEGDTKNQIEIKSIFINPKLSFYNMKYIDYIKNSKDNLVDLMSNFDKINSLSDNDLKINIKRLYQGAITDNSKNSSNFKDLDYNNSNYEDYMDNTWANIFQGGYTIIRLVDVDFDNLKNSKNLKENNPIWIRPIACIVIKQNDKNDKNRHLIITKKVLSIHNEIVNLIKEKFNYIAYQKVIESEKDRDRFSAMITQINHSAKKWLKIHPIINNFLKEDNKNYEDFLKKLSPYIETIYNLASILEIEKDNNKNETSFKNLFYDAFGNKTKFYKSLKSFVENVSEFNDSYKSRNLTVNIEKCDLKFNCEDKHLKILISELIINAIKNMPKNANNSTIYINIQEDYFEIKNKVDEKEVKIDYINTKNKDGSLGMKTIRSFLKKQNKEISAEIENDYIVIKIYEKGAKPWKR